MKDLLSHLDEYFEKNDEFKRRMEKFSYVKNSEDWEFFVFMLRSVQGVMVNDMLTRRYADLEPVEKDITSKTYYHVNRMVEFFINPITELRKRKKWNLPSKHKIEEAIKTAAYKQP